MFYVCQVSLSFATLGSDVNKPYAYVTKRTNPTEVFKSKLILGKVVRSSHLPKCC